MKSLAALVPLLLLSACLEGNGATEGLFESPDGSQKPSPSDQATLTGTIGVSDVEGGCPYIEAPDGTRFEVIYPDGWQADRQSGALRNPDGEVVARAGDMVTVRGEPAEEMASICQIGPIFRATEVVQPGT